MPCSYFAVNVCATEVKPRLILKKIDDTLIQKGVYHFQLAIRPEGLASASLILQEGVSKFGIACTELVKILPSSNCKIFKSSLIEIQQIMEERNKFIETFFKPRPKRGFLKAIGAMDSEDRERLDINMDKLRKNEEYLKQELGHQVEVVNSMYDFLNHSALQMNNRLSTFYNHIGNISEEINNGLTIINKFSEILVLESNLVELRFFIELVAKNLRIHQENAIRLLLNEQINIDMIFELIEPTNLVKIFDKADSTLGGKLGFPRKMNGNIYPELIGLLNVSHKVVENAWIQVSLLIPLVDRRAFNTFKASFTPGIVNSTIAIVKAAENILILEENSVWGLEITETELSQCHNFHNTYFCTFPLIEHNMVHRNSCVAGFYFHNITTYCKTTYFKTSKEIWFQSSKSNTWTYVAPEALQLEIINGARSTHITVYGVGNVSLTQGMSIRSKNAFIQYNEISDQYLYIEVTGHNFTFKPQFNQSTVDSSNIPVIALNESVYSSFNMKDLFDLGIDARDLHNRRAPLQNIEYDPINYPWHIAGVITAITILVGVIFCCRLTLRIAKRRKTSGINNVTISLPTNSFPININDAVVTKGEPVYATPSTVVKNFDNDLIESEETLPPPPPPPFPEKNSMRQINKNSTFKKVNLHPLDESQTLSSKCENNLFHSSSLTSLNIHKKKVSGGVKVSRKNR